jgi:hypothetical protein
MKKKVLFGTENFSQHWQKILASTPVLRFLATRTATNDPFVYRLGLQVFILARRVRLPYGSPLFPRKRWLVMVNKPPIRAPLPGGFSISPNQSLRESPGKSRRYRIM